MKQHSNFNSVIGTRDNFKNGAKLVSKLGNMAMIAIIAMFIANIANAQGGANSQGANQQSIKTVYASKDWVVSDFVVTDPRFGAKAEPGFDNRSAFQAAIDAADKKGHQER
jgi:hypothetical protein